MAQTGKRLGLALLVTVLSGINPSLAASRDPLADLPGLVMRANPADAVGADRDSLTLWRNGRPQLLITGQAYAGGWVLASVAGGSASFTRDGQRRDLDLDPTRGAPRPTADPGQRDALYAAMTGADSEAAALVQRVNESDQCAAWNSAASNREQLRAAMLAAIGPADTDRYDADLKRADAVWGEIAQLEYLQRGQINTARALSGRPPIGPELVTGAQIAIYAADLAKMLPGMSDDGSDLLGLTKGWRRIVDAPPPREGAGVIYHLVKCTEAQLAERTGCAAPPLRDPPPLVQCPVKKPEPVSAPTAVVGDALVGQPEAGRGGAGLPEDVDRNPPPGIPVAADPQP